MSARLDGLGPPERLGSPRRDHAVRAGGHLDTPPAIARRLDSVLPPGTDFASALRMQLELARVSARQS